MRHISALFLILFALTWVPAPGHSAISSGQLPEKMVQVLIKDKPFKETMQKLFAMTDLKVQFAKDLDIERTVYIDVESVKWSLIVTSALEAYELKYRFVNPKTVEIYRP